MDLLSAPSRSPLELARALAAAPAGSLTRIFRGVYPRTMEMDEAGASAWFDGYLRTYVERDVRALGNVEDLQAFTRFTRMCAQLTSGEINRSHVGREIGMDPKTAGRWLSVLESSFQWLEIPPWSGNAVKRLSGRHKGHFTDTGFAAFMASISSPEALASHPLAESLFETYVTCEIGKVLQVLPIPPSMYHWRTHGGAEVDLILEKDGFFWPIEVKLASRPSARDVRGLDGGAGRDGGSSRISPRRRCGRRRGARPRGRRRGVEVRPPRSAGAASRKRAGLLVCRSHRDGLGLRMGCASSDRAAWSATWWYRFGIGEGE